jgi:hypothetical protein
MGITDVLLAIFPVIDLAVKSGAAHPADKGIASGPLGMPPFPQHCHRLDRHPNH